MASSVCHALRAVLVAAGVAVGAAGCASYSGSGLAPGTATAAQTRALMGAPAAVHRAAPGAAYVESWEYPRGPLGRHTYMARFDGRGVLVSIDQVLTVETAARIRIGQDTRDDVRRLLGRPAMVYPARGGGESWDYAAFASDGQARRIRIVVEFDARGVAAAAGENQDPEEQGGTLGAIAL
ncbi:MAG: outer membrane protein assembly factor BamE [Burkholderiales bacterium]|nr:outer membrane protein assembly factor BamE [Burkholderiales bacterium]